MGLWSSATSRRERPGWECPPDRSGQESSHDQRRPLRRPRAHSTPRSQPRVEAGIAALFAATSFVDGPPVADFEREYAAHRGRPLRRRREPGTDALELALRRLRVSGPGGERSCSPPTASIATAGAGPDRCDTRARGLRRRPAAHRPRPGRGDDHRPHPGGGSRVPLRPARADGPPQGACDAAGVPLVEDAAQFLGRPAGRVRHATATVAATSLTRARTWVPPATRARSPPTTPPSPPRYDGCATTVR